MKRFLDYIIAGVISLLSTISYSQEWRVWASNPMRKLLLGLLLLAGPAQAGELRLLEVDSLYFETSKIYHKFDPYFDKIRYDYDAFGNKLEKSGEYWTHGVAGGFDLTFVEYGDFRWTWENRVEGDSSNRQFRRVAWKYTTEMRYGSVSAFLSHRSEHLLDEDYHGFYPLEDTGGIRLYFLGGE